MYLWCADARQAIKNIDQIEDTLIEKTAQIDSFLSAKGRHHFVIATKGVGKSLLLILKRKSLRGIDYFIPKKIPLDAPEVTFASLNKQAKNFLYEKKPLDKFWSISIIISIINNIDKYSELLRSSNRGSECLKRLISFPYYTTVSSVFGGILSEIRSREFYEDLLNDYNAILVPIAQSINENVALFIDNIDECFEDAPRELWYDAQFGLMKAISKIIRLNPNLRLFTSIRKEAFLKLANKTDMFIQYSNVSLDIKYYRDDLKQMFIKNIILEKPDNLADKTLRTTNPITAFVGAQKIPHMSVDETEDPFDYIYRHTLRRPRDFMEMGHAISNCPISGRDVSTESGLRRFKQLINDTATILANNYLIEIERHLVIQKNDFERIFTLIDTNVLDKAKLKQICMTFNQSYEHCNTTDCKNCKDKIHVFCELYKIGLLGFLSESFQKDKKFIQRFEMVGEKTFDEVGLLPESPFYLLHPIIEHIIKQKNHAFRLNEDNIIGYSRVWNERKSVDYCAYSYPRPTIFISSTMDLKSYRDAIEDVCKEKDYIPIRSENLNRANILQEIKELSRSCHLFVLIFGPRYGEEIEGKSICEHEFDAAYGDNPRKIIVYVIEGNTNDWDTRQQQFLERVQSINTLAYGRGERIKIINIKDRFKRDEIEKRAVLLR